MENVSAGHIEVSQQVYLRTYYDAGINRLNKLFSFRVVGRKMTVKTVPDLKKALTKQGYTKRASEEIAKWYE